MRGGNFWFTTETALPFFQRDSDFNNANLVSHDSSRKQFFGKLLGLCAVVGLVPRLLAKTPITLPAESFAAATASTLIRAEPRAVSRRVDSL